MAPRQARDPTPTHCTVVREWAGIRGPCVHPRGPCVHTRGPRVHPPLDLDSLLAPGHDAHCSNGCGLGAPSAGRAPSIVPAANRCRPLRETVQQGRRHQLSGARANHPGGRNWPGRGAQFTSPQSRLSGTRHHPIAKCSRAPHHGNGRSATRAAAERAKPCAIEASTTRVERHLHAAMRR